MGAGWRLTGGTAFVHEQDTLSLHSVGSTQEEKKCPDMHEYLLTGT